MKWLMLLMILGVEMLSAQIWHLKVPGGGLGSPLTYNPHNIRMLYGAAGSLIMYASRDAGNTWSPYGNPVPGVGGQIKSIAVSPLDTLQLLVGVETGFSTPDRILKSSDAGQTWTQTWGGSFSYYGQPIEFKPVHPDTVYTMGNDTIWRSTNFGSTWDTVRVLHGLFTAWCDAELRPDSANIMYVGDATTGIWKTMDYGVTWRNVFATTAAEIPCIAVDPFNYQIAYAGRYGGSGVDVGGLLKTTDGGETWHCISTPIKVCGSPVSGNSWWIAPCLANPGYVYFGTYGANPNGIFLTRDGGSSWQYLGCGLVGALPLNYSLLAIDTNSVVAVQNNGIWKLDYTINLRMVSPNGGEQLDTASHFTISWVDSSIQGYFSQYVRLEFSADDGQSWTKIADSIPSTQYSYDWTVPSTPSGTCRMRVVDVGCSTIIDEADSNFSIVPGIVGVKDIAGTPVSFSLGQNYPNPFNPSTRFDVTLPTRAHVLIKVYTVLGQEIATILDADRPAGKYEMQWNGKDTRQADLGNGVYYVRMTATGIEKSSWPGQAAYVGVRKIVLLK